MTFHVFPAASKWFEFIRNQNPDGYLPNLSIEEIAQSIGLR
jgi:hypothetical protein